MDAEAATEIGVRADSAVDAIGREIKVIREIPEADREKLKGEAAIKLLKEARIAVDAEYERSLSETGQSQEAVQMQKKHGEMVVVLAREGVKLCKETGVAISEEQENLILLMAVMHDAAKVAPERRPGDRLIMHGWDSSNWALNFLHGYDFSPELIGKVMVDMEAHMGMPFVNRALAKKLHESADQDRLVLPEKFRLPESIEAAVVYAADLLSPTIMADKDGGPAGCFDRYLMINMAVKQNGPDGKPNFGEAYSSAGLAVKDNVEVLMHPIQAEMRPEAARVEQIMGARLGGDALKQFDDFERWCKDNGISFDDLRGPDIQSTGENETTSAQAIMQRYYQLHKRFVSETAEGQ